MEKHRKRNCLYAEAEFCKKRKLDDKKIIDRQINIYSKKGFPHNAGLYASYMIAREHNDSFLCRLNEMWWQHVQAFSRRDQISFPFIFNRYPISNIGAGTRSKITTIKNHVQ